MLDYDQAEAIAKQHLESLAKEGGFRLRLLTEHTIHKEYGWIFFYNSEIYLETKNDSYALAGNAPFLVQKSDGKMVSFGTAHPTEHYIDEHEKRK